MRILILTHAYPPEIRSTSVQMAELAEGMVQLGHQVTVLAPLPKYNLSDSSQVHPSLFFDRGIKNGVTVIRIATLPIHFAGPFVRAFGYASITLGFFILGLFQKNVDLVFAYSTPMTLGLTCVALKWFKRVPFVFNVQDLFPQNAIDLGLLKNRVLIVGLRFLEIFAYRRAALITVHSKGNADYIIGHGIEAHRVRVMNNWVDTEHVRPLGVELSFRQKWGLEEKFVALFAGVMGYAQDLDVILDAAKEIKDLSCVRFLLVGDGVEKNRLAGRVRGEGIGNVMLKPLMGNEEYPKLLAGVDIGLVTLRATMKTPVVPSKIFGYWAAAKPVVASLNRESDANEIIGRSGAGFVLPAGNAVELADKIRYLAGHPDAVERMGLQGRRYVEDHFSKKVCLNLYSKFFDEINPATAAKRAKETQGTTVGHHSDRAPSLATAIQGKDF
ncbi:MAG: glycosyltransferase family 4 protein [Elusimicrobia bacterium]|nr:glycosyltransferase family 4 protein [Elusimicrobiota bacterium]